MSGRRVFETLKQKNRRTAADYSKPSIFETAERKHTDQTQCCPKYVKQKQQPEENDEKKSYSSILKKPFFFRTAESLDKAVRLEEKRLAELYQQQLNQSKLQDTSSSTFTSSLSSTFTSTSTSTSSKSSLVSTSTPESKHEIKSEDRLAKYVLSSTAEEEEEHEEYEESPFKEKKFVADESKAMLLAQQYLASHKIFEFFHFLIAHLLSVLPVNPINFLLDLLDKCLVYRAGLSSPPLLYEKKHIEALYNVMDPMKSGYIDLQQYAAGMKTLGLCGIQPSFRTNPDNQIDKETFITDALDGLLSILNDLLRRKTRLKIRAYTTTPPPTPLLRLSISDKRIQRMVVSQGGKHRVIKQ